MNDNDFFPSSDYSLPVSSNFMKFVEGDNNFRVLSSAVIGWEYWNKENKPVRSREEFTATPDIRKGGRINHFWAFIVWNYEAKRIQVLELTQKGIMSSIQAYVKNPKWGSPKGFDITVTRKGSGLDSEYTTTPSPHSMIPSEAVAALESKAINLEALYEGGDPFVVNEI